MTAANRRGLAAFGRALWVLALTATAGGGLGWLIRSSGGHTFDQVYAVLDPACVGAVSIGLLQRRVRHSRWLVPLLLVFAMLNVAVRPHTPVLSAIGLGAGAVAILCALCGRNRAAIVATLLACSSIAVTLFAGLS